MSDEREPYIDPNSGAAPQPGGYAGAHAYADGHGHVPPGYDLDDEGDLVWVDDDDDLDEDEDESDDDGVTQEEAANAKSLETQAIDPSAEPDEGAGAEAIPGSNPDGELDEFTSQEAADAHALETQGIEVGHDDDDEDEDDEEEEEEEPAKAYDDLLAKNLPEIQDYLEKHPDERDAVVAAERERAAAAEKEPRKGIVGDD